MCAYRLGALMLSVITMSMVSAQDAVSVVASPPVESANTHYVHNQPPLLPSPFSKLPVGQIEPRGWLRKQLELEAEGFIGHLTEISKFLRKEHNAWLSPTGEGDFGWEEVPYWLRGFGNLGYILRDERIIKEARVWIEGVLSSQAESGYFGPRANLTSLDGKPDVWPHMIMLDALRSYYEFTRDERVLDLMAGFFRWELDWPEQDFLLPFWQQQRAADNLANVYWLYNIRGDKYLLELAEKIHRRTANWTDGVADWHGVNIAQAFRGPAVYYQQAKDPKFLRAAERNYAEVMGIYGQVPGGGFGADENARPGYIDPRQATETCTWAEYMRSFEMLLTICGDPIWADRCEEVTFNSLPASMTADQKALHYLTSPNLVRCDRGNKAPGIQNDGDMFSFNPHRYRCCQHNVSQAWPYFVEHLWLATPDNGVAAALYAPAVAKVRVGPDGEVTLQPDTNYPFDDRIAIRLAVPQAVRFPLYLRVPGWCTAPEVQVNGQPQKLPAAPRGYIVLERAWQDGDRVELCLPMSITLHRWTKNKDSVSVSRGPLTYALKIGEQIVRAGGTDAWPAYEILPTTPWNYGLVLRAGEPAASFEVLTQAWPEDDLPFTAEAAPVALRASARRIPAWKEDARGRGGRLQPSPARSKEPLETVTLIPMGCARLRIASFPTIGDGPDAHDWVVPEATRAPAQK